MDASRTQRRLTQLRSIALQGNLKAGENTIVAVCKNAGGSPNAAGFYFAGQLAFEKSQPITIVSDATWQWSSQIPSMNESYLGGLSGEFSEAVVIESLGA